MGWKSWSADWKKKSDKEKYDIIVRKFEEHKIFLDFDKGDLTAYLKELFENGWVLISNAAFNIGPDIFKNINKNKGFDSGKWSVKQYQLDEYDFDRTGKGVIWEHVVPAKVLILHAYDLWEQGSFEVGDYQELKRKYGFVCVITKDENKRLNDKRLREKMPENFIWEKMNYDNPFARYFEAHINVIKPEGLNEKDIICP